MSSCYSSDYTSKLQNITSFVQSTRWHSCSSYIEQDKAACREQIKNKNEHGIYYQLETGGAKIILFW